MPWQKREECVIFLGFPTKQNIFCISLLFQQVNISILTHYNIQIAYFEPRFRVKVVTWPESSRLIRSYITTFVTNSDNMVRLTLCFSTTWDVFTPSLVPMLGFWRPFLKHPLKLLRAVCISGNITFLVLLGHLNISSLVACFLHDLPTGVHMLQDLLRKHQKIKGRSNT